MSRALSHGRRMPLLPASALVRDATIGCVQRKEITKASAIDQLIQHCGMSGVDAAREVANAVEVKV